MVKYLITSYFKLHGHPLDDISVILTYISVRIKKKQEAIKKNQVTSSAKPAREVLHKEQTLNRRKLFFLKSEHMLL